MQKAGRCVDEEILSTRTAVIRDETDTVYFGRLACDYTGPEFVGVGLSENLVVECFGACMVRNEVVG